MTWLLKRTMKGVLATQLGWWLSAPMRRRGVVVLTYHRVVHPGDTFIGVAPRDFRAQLLWLKRHCELIAPEQYAEAIRRSDRVRASVLVTFDDGYRDYHDHAYPVLQELKIPSLVFLPTAFIGTERLLWTDALTWAFVHTRQTAVRVPWRPGDRWELADTVARRRACDAAKAHLKGTSDAERKELQSDLMKALKIDPEDGSAGRQMLTWNEVRATLEHTRYGGHTHTHAILSQVSASDLDAEIRLCRDVIERELGARPRCFAYPNGRVQDFNPSVKEALRRHGFELAFSMIGGVNGPDTDHYAILRQPTGCASIADFAWLVAGRQTT
jgi:peptidoglycan/xylan/chitin deacetylase (PgdA/CDA1 family)